MAFDAADILRVGKDIFLRRSQTANHLAVDWLRREFPNLRVHMTHHKDDYTRHNDSYFIPLRPPTPGSEGICLLN
jgi:glycine amidinotransferase